MARDYSLDYEFESRDATVFTTEADAAGVWIKDDRTDREVLTLKRSQALDLIACLVRAVQHSAELAVVTFTEGKPG